MEGEAKVLCPVFSIEAVLQLEEEYPFVTTMMAGSERFAAKISFAVGPLFRHLLRSEPLEAGARRDTEC